MSNIYYWEKVMLSKLRFSWKENLKKCTSFEEQQGTRHKPVFWHYRLQLSFVYEKLSQISFNLFCSGDKSLLSGFLRKCGWFYGHNERFPNASGIPRIFPQYSENVPYEIPGEYSQIIFREYCSWNIRGTFPWYIPRIFGKKGP